MDISQQQIEQYQRDGAILLKGVLGHGEQLLLERGLEESYTNPGKRSSRASNTAGQGETFMESFSCLTSPSLQQLLEIGSIAEIAAKMMRAISAQLILDQIFYKAKGTVIPTPWHQDTPYLRVRGDDMVRVWLTADFVPRELSLQIVRGSHRWNVIYDPRIADGGSIRKTGEGRLLSMSRQEAGAGPAVPDIETYRDSFDILNWDVEPGDALVFNGNMLHAAGGLTDYPHPRRAYTTMWGGPDLLYIDPPDNAIPTLAQINKIAVPDGARVGDYPDAFPIGWREQPGP